MQRSYFTLNDFHFRYVPNITSLSYNTGGTEGRLLNVKGTGFTSNISNYKCTISGL